MKAELRDRTGEIVEYCYLPDGRWRKDETIVRLRKGRNEYYSYVGIQDGVAVFAEEEDKG